MWVMQETANKPVAECPWSPAGCGAGGIMAQCERAKTQTKKSP